VPLGKGRGGQRPLVATPTTTPRAKQKNTHKRRHFSLMERYGAALRWPAPQKVAYVILNDWKRSPLNGFYSFFLQTNYSTLKMSNPILSTYQTSNIISKFSCARNGSLQNQHSLTFFFPFFCYLRIEF